MDQIKERNIKPVATSVINPNLKRRELKDKAADMVVGLDSSNIEEFNPQSSKGNRLLNKFYNRYQHKFEKDKFVNAHISEVVKWDPKRQEQWFAAKKNQSAAPILGGIVAVGSLPWTLTGIITSPVSTTFGIAGGYTGGEIGQNYGEKIDYKRHNLTNNSLLGQVVGSILGGTTSAIGGNKLVNNIQQDAIPLIKSYTVSKSIGKKHPKILDKIVEDGNVNWRNFDRFQKYFWNKVGTKEHLGTRKENVKWHKLDRTTLDHTKTVVNNTLLEPISNNQPDLIKAALFHDFAKPLHNGYGINHATTSAMIAKNLGLTKDITTAIKGHMKFSLDPPAFSNEIASSLKRADMNFGSELIPIYRSHLQINTHQSADPKYVGLWYSSSPEKAAGYYLPRLTKTKAPVYLKKALIPKSKLEQLKAKTIKQDNSYREDELIVPIGFESIKTFNGPTTKNKSLPQILKEVVDVFNKD